MGHKRRVCELASSAGRRDKGGSRCCLQLRGGVRRRWSQAVVMPRDGIRGNGGKVQQGRFWLNVRREVLPVGVVQPWNRPQRGGEISILGNTQNLTRRGPKHPDLTLKLALL